MKTDSRSLVLLALGLALLAYAWFQSGSGRARRVG
jgi:hypothetical protein